MPEEQLNTIWSLLARYQKRESIMMRVDEKNCFRVVARRVKMFTRPLQLHCTIRCSWG